MPKMIDQWRRADLYQHRGDALNAFLLGNLWPIDFRSESRCWLQAGLGTGGLKHDIRADTGDTLPNFVNRSGVRPTMTRIKVTWSETARMVTPVRTGRALNPEKMICHFIGFDVLAGLQIHVVGSVWPFQCERRRSTGLVQFQFSGYSFRASSFRWDG